MEVTLEEMRKLLPAPSAVAKLSQPPAPKATPKTPKEKTQQLFDELTDRLQQQKVEEALAAAARIEVPTSAIHLVEVLAPSVVLAASPSVKNKKTEPELGSRAANSEPASQRSGKKKENVPTPKLQELEEEEESAEEDTTESEEREVPSTPPPDQKPKGRKTRFSSKKKPGPTGVYRSLFAPKRQSKTPAKGEGSTKKPRGK